MHVIRARNVHTALPLGLRHLSEVGAASPSRAGGVLVAPTPVTTVYDEPRERVLFWPERDANPFFHFFESLWMLGGRNDLAFLTHFVQRFGDFSDDGSTLAGAYGFRWREYWDTDQLKSVIQLLKNNPNSRRAVICMWDPRLDLQVTETRKDTPCNTQIYVWSSFGKRDEPNRLNMTVACRSNDIIWGAYGANAVQFSVLQEYLAAHLGLVVGSLYQISNNFHAYVDVYNKTRVGALSSLEALACPYAHGTVTPYPIVEDPATWDRDLALFLEDPAAVGFINPFFRQVAKPLWWAHAAVKRKAWKNALEIIEQCQATDWRLAAEEWITRRADVWKAKTKATLEAERTGIF